MRLSRTNLHIYPSFFTNESRIVREAKAIIELGLADEVLLVGLWKENLPEEEMFSDRVKLIRVRTKIAKELSSVWNILVFLHLFLATFRLCRRYRPFAINIHSLTMFPAGLAAKFFIGSKIIYDAHELETETQASKGIRRIVAKVFERFCIQFADRIVVVSQSIEEWYKSHYTINHITTIRNIPLLETTERSNQLRTLLKVNDQAILFLYVGVLNKGRGLNLLIDLFRKIDNPDWHLIFLGYGQMEHEIRDVISSNIHLLPAVPSAKVAEMASGADVGLGMGEYTCLSYKLSLPNKVFEYMAAGIPFISSDFPDVRREFEAVNVCWIADPDPSLEFTLRRITKPEIETRKANVLKHREKWNWAKEKYKLIDVYKDLQ